MSAESKWSREHQNGIPTQAKKLSKLIAAVKKHKTQGDGAESKED